jgi:hypothetical protein
LAAGLQAAEILGTLFSAKGIVHVKINENPGRHDYSAIMELFKFMETLMMVKH